MKKTAYKIATIHGAVEVSGYVDRDSGLAYCRSDDGKGWVCSDYRTGLKISGGSTRKEAADIAAMRNLDAIRSDPAYLQANKLNT